ncbi:MAG: DUF481 domain-containing protein [Ignavibacteriae bacterium]|nr:DUF481 domain-containing protein [Ignavibacteriota bacterium]MCB9217115.1 DUF481 domain-containing protein [Ignavibacteria bacterium]
MNTEVYRIRPVEQGVTNNLSLNFSFYSGNTDFFKIGGNYRGDFLDGDIYSFLILNYQYGEESKEIFVRNGFSHLRGVYTIAPAVRAELFTQLGFDDFILQRNRFLVGGGGRFTIGELKDSTLNFSLYIGVGGMYEREDEGDDTLNVVTELPRSTNYLSMALNVHEKFGLKIVTYYQPAVTRFHDFRILLDAGIGFEILSGLSVTTSVDWRYDSDPFPGVESYDLSLSNGLTLTF